MNKFLFLIIPVVLLFSCNEKDKSINVKKQPVAKAKETPKTLTPKVLGNYMGKENYILWSPKQSDIPKYWVRVEFEEDFLVYQLHGQCMYYFFTNYYHTKTDEIELLWSYKTDCLRNLEYMTQSNGVKKFPKHGDSFSVYKLVNDSVIKVKYKFPEWIHAVNKKAQDSIFPNYLYLEKDER